MALKGDTRAVGLADIFQALALSKREGILSVSSGGKEMKVHFSAGGVRLLSTGSLRHTRLGSILLEKEDFSPEDLEFALQMHRSTGRKLGDVLVEYGLLTRDEIEDCLRRQIEEEICEIFLWNNAEFTFDPGLPREGYFDPTGEGRVFDINVSRLLVEAARNVDEWTVLLVRVQNSAARYVYKNGYPVMPDTSPFGIPLAVVSRLPFILNKPLTIDEIAESLQLVRDSAVKLVAYLIRRGRIFEAAGEPSAAPAQPVFPREASDNWRRPKSWAVDDLGYRARLDEIVLSARTREEAASRMADLADLARQEGNSRVAADVLTAALELSPQDRELRKLAVQAYVSQWKFAEAAKLVVEGCQMQQAGAS
jgi:hypothetical protein